MNYVERPERNNLTFWQVSHRCLLLGRGLRHSGERGGRERERDAERGERWDGEAEREEKREGGSLQLFLATFNEKGIKTEEMFGNPVGGGRGWQQPSLDR